MPENHAALDDPWSPDRFASWARRIGPETESAVARVMESRSIVEQSFVACRNILGLSKTYTPALLERACAKMNAASALPSYTGLKNAILAMKAADAEARAKARETEGFTYAEERRYDILEGAAKNESAAGGLINMGVGFGVGAGISREVSNIAGQMNGTAPETAPAPEGGSTPCTACGAAMPAGAKFCMNCGQARPTARFCPECGTKAQDGARFCMNCGARLG